MAQTNYVYMYINRNRRTGSARRKWVYKLQWLDGNTPAATMLLWTFTRSGTGKTQTLFFPTRARELHSTKKCMRIRVGWSGKLVKRHHTEMSTGKERDQF